MFSSLGEDVLEAVEQLGALIVEASRIGKVIPLHTLAQREHSYDRVSVLDRLALNELRCLLD